MALGPFAEQRSRLSGQSKQFDIGHRDEPPENIQLVILNGLASGIYLGQGFQDGYPLQPTPTGAGSTTAGMAEA